MFHIGFVCHCAYIGGTLQFALFMLQINFQIFWYFGFGDRWYACMYIVNYTVAADEMWNFFGCIQTALQARYL